MSDRSADIGGHYIGGHYVQLTPEDLRVILDKTILLQKYMQNVEALVRDIEWLTSPGHNARYPRSEVEHA